MPAPSPRKYVEASKPLELVDVYRRPFASVRVASDYIPWRLVPKAKFGEKQQRGFFEVPRLLQDYVHSEVKRYQGKLEFEVLASGWILVATGQKNWGDRGLSGGDWRREIQSREQLREIGWVEVGELNGGDWLLLSRQCKKGEQLTVRTKKYQTAILIFPKKSVPREKLKDK